MKIKTNRDWLIDHYPEDLGFALSYGKSFGVTELYETRFCDNDFVSGEEGLISYQEAHTFPEKHRIEFLKKHFCDECVFRRQCKIANKTKDPKDFKNLGCEKDYWLVQLHEWPVAKTLRTLKFPFGITIPKGRLVEVIKEEKTDLLTKDENGNKVPIEFYYIIRYKDELYSATKQDIEIKENYTAVI